MSASPPDPARRARTRRLALTLALVAFGVYVGFIALSLVAGRG